MRTKVVVELAGSLQDRRVIRFLFRLLLRLWPNTLQTGLYLQCMGKRVTPWGTASNVGLQSFGIQQLNES